MLVSQASEPARQPQSAQNTPRAQRLRRIAIATTAGVHAAIGAAGTTIAAVADLDAPVLFGVAAMAVTAAGYGLAVAQFRHLLVASLDAADAWEQRYNRFAEGQTRIADAQRQLLAEQTLRLQSYAHTGPVVSAW